MADVSPELSVASPLVATVVSYWSLPRAAALAVVVAETTRRVSLSGDPGCSVVVFAVVRLQTMDALVSLFHQNLAFNFLIQLLGYNSPSWPNWVVLTTRAIIWLSADGLR